MKLKNIITAFSCMACMGTLVSCSDTYSHGDDAIYIAGTENDPLLTFGFEDTPATYAFGAASSAKVASDVTVTYKIDNSLLASYNAKHGTNYQAVPEGTVELINPEATIEAGKASSTASYIKLLSTENLEIGPTYVVPVTIQSAKGSSYELLEPSRTMFLKLSQTITFNALDMTNPNMYAIYPFDDSKAIDMSAGFTYELKLYINEWHGSSAGNIQRVCAFEGKDESNSSMLRFGESGKPWGTLQWVSPGGALQSNTVFIPGKWYNLALVYDGSAYTMYVDGVKDVTMGGSKDTQFQWFEFGMAWTSYINSQRFLGRLAELRVWNRALSTSEIAAGKCAVAVNSDGLKAYWKLGEGEGHIFKDATGNGYDIDMTNCIREVNEDAGRVAQDKSGEVRWSIDDNNKCTN